MKPFEEGMQAFKRGNLVNPYKPDNSRHRDWEFGFNKAYFANLEQVKEKEQDGRAGTT
jgi:hypothetical protein